MSFAIFVPQIPGDPTTAAKMSQFDELLLDS